MGQDTTHRHGSDSPWPIDLRIFATLAGVWAICLLISAYFHAGDESYGSPLQAIFAGTRFEDAQARVVLMVEAGIFGAISFGILARRRWGLLLALFFMCEVVLSHLTFVIAYMPIRSEWRSVKSVAMQGPTLVLITLYLWIRSTELIFGDGRAVHPTPQETRIDGAARPRTKFQSDSRTEARVDSRTESRTGEVRRVV
jgi:hypothetical protein